MRIIVEFPDSKYTRMMRIFNEFGCENIVVVEKKAKRLARAAVKGRSKPRIGIAAQLSAHLIVAGTLKTPPRPQTFARSSAALGVTRRGRGQIGG